MPAATASPASVGLRRARTHRAPLHITIVFGRDVPTCIVLQKRRRGYRDDRADQNVERDWGARFVGGEECRRDQRCWTAGNDRRELTADRRAAIAQQNTFRLLWPSGKHLTPTLRAFVDFVVEYVELENTHQ
jgi:hypothetical protein